jgi:hypothetical protein
VPEPLSHVGDRHPGRQQRRREHMPQAVRRDPPHAQGLTAAGPENYEAYGIGWLSSRTLDSQSSTEMPP